MNTLDEKLKEYSDFKIFVSKEKDRNDATCEGKGTDTLRKMDQAKV